MNGWIRRRSRRETGFGYKFNLGAHRGSLSHEAISRKQIACFPSASDAYYQYYYHSPAARRGFHLLATVASHFKNHILIHTNLCEQILKIKTSCHHDSDFFNHMRLLLLF